MTRFRRGWPSLPAGLALAGALAAVVGWPALATVLAAVGGEPGLEAGGGLMTPEGSGGVRRPLGLAFETVRLVLATEALALPVGLPLAFLLFRTDAWGRRGLIGLLAVAAFVPLPLHATAWLGALGNAGRAQALGVAPVLVGWSGAAFVHAVAALPWVVVLAGVGLRGVEPGLEESALLDLPARRVVAGVTFRRGLGAAAAAALAAAVLTAGDMTVTDLLQVRTYAEEAYLQYNLGNGPGAAGAVALPPLAVLGLLVAYGARRFVAAGPGRLGPASSRPRVWRLGGWRVPAGLAALAVVGNGVALPLYGLVWRAGRVGGRAAAGRPPGWSAAGLVGTLGFAWDEARGPLAETAAVSAAGATAAAALAWGLAWSARRSSAWRAAAVAAVAVALAAPGPVAGMALVLAYRSVPPVYDSAARLVLAAVLRTFPYAFLVVWPAVTAVPQGLLDVAAVEGFGPAARAARVGLPATRSAAVAAWGVAFALAVGELPATNLNSPPGWNPLSVLIWGLLHTGVESHLAGVVLVTLAAVAAAGGFAAFAMARVVKA